MDPCVQCLQHTLLCLRGLESDSRDKMIEEKEIEWELKGW